ncbi:cytochrome P450 [Lentzea sp. NPDC004782]|uniref:cytochrome P450 n=1 Tax=Lentzea sp. NPDC004782 TaxID=3154458 RepID=UPI0033B21EE9
MSITEHQESIPEELGKLPITELTTCPHEAFARLRDTSPAIPVESAGHRYWAITRYEDVRRVLSDPSVARDRTKHGNKVNPGRAVRTDAKHPRVPRGVRQSPFYEEGERHQLLRNTLGTIFTPRKMAELTRKVRDSAEELLETFHRGQPIDFLTDYAYPISGKVICAIAGIAGNERNIRAAIDVEALLTPVVSEVERAARSLADWAAEIADAKRQEPGDDVFTTLLRFHDEGLMTSEELTSSYVFLLIGGMEVAITIGNGAFTFMTHPGELAKALARPELFDTCVDEIVRYESNFRFLSPHVVTQALHFDGVTVPPGELLLISLGAANRDPHQFDEPDTFDITRTTTGHLGFGHGVHRCPGAQLGKAEVAVALQMFFERFPRTALVDPPDQARWQPGKFKRRLEALPVIPL